MVRRKTETRLLPIKRPHVSAAAQLTVTGTRVVPGRERGRLTVSRVGAAGAIRSAATTPAPAGAAITPAAIGAAGGLAGTTTVSTTTVRPGLSAVDVASVTSIE